MHAFEDMSVEKTSKDFHVALIGGGIAGTSVDVALFPLDTIKTRLQSANGFFRSGGFRGIYSGLSAAAVGSAPGAALFFSAYETVKGFGLHAFPQNQYAPIVHMTAASLGEVTACLIRVPTEIVKQRMQTGVFTKGTTAVATILKQEGILGFYKGYGSMVAREIPFSLIQFPLWESLKARWSNHMERPCSSLEGAVCGSIAGGFSAAITTPLDVIKTRLMLGKDANGKPYVTTLDTFSRIRAEEGIAKLFSGVGPRVLWITIGGFVFFGTYEAATNVISTRD